MLLLNLKRYWIKAKTKEGEEITKIIFAIDDEGVGEVLGCEIVEIEERE